MIGRTISHYRILEPLGGGGMGVVYKAEDLTLKRTVALKFLPPELTRDPEAKERFIREAQAASALDHQNICVIHDVGQDDDGQLFIVMTYYQGETLRERIARGPLKVNDAVELSIQIAQGLARAHAHGIIHRDIKPGNIVITPSGEAKILDFGLAKLTGGSLVTRAGAALGTTSYMSPEQTQGDPVDARTDIWSLGVVLYEMLTGQLPFRADYENAVFYAIQNAEPVPVTALRTGVPMELERIVRKCLAKDPRDRYQHVDELLVDLRGSRSAPVSSPAPLTGSRPASRRKRVVWYGAAFALIAVALGAFLLLHRGSVGPAQLKMIAVLPFENLGPAEDEYFADGLTDEITSRLSTVRSLGVISRTSAMQYKKTTKSLPQVARELGVEYVLEGSVRWVRSAGGQRLRVTPELIRVSDDVHLWADNLDRTLNDIFAIQTEIASQVVNALDLVLGESQKRAIESVPTSNLEAYQVYLRGLSYADRIERPNIETAMTLFQRVVELDSSFALAYAQLAWANLYYYWLGYDPSPDRLSRAKGSIDRAFALQPELSDAFFVLGCYWLFGYRDYERALGAFAAAEQRDPNNTRARGYPAYIWRRQGKFDAALQRLMEWVQRDPRDAEPLIEAGNTLRMMGRFDEAVPYLDRALDLMPDASDAYLWKATCSLLGHGDTKESRRILEEVPKQYAYWANFVWLDVYDRDYRTALNRLAAAPVTVLEGNYDVTPVSELRGLVYRFMGDSVRSRAAFDTARQFLESEVQQRPGDYRPHKSLALAYAAVGRSDDAVREAQRSMDLLPVSRDAWAGVFPVIAMAQVHVMLGMNSEALRDLESILSSHASKELTVPLLRIDPMYDPLRGDPGFQALLKKYG